MKDLNELFHHMLKDVLYAEKQILKNLPKMSKQAQTPELKEAFDTHREETQVQVERLGQVFEMIGKSPRAETCDAMLGLIEEAQSVMTEAKDPDVKDAGMLAAAQAVEHYEIARYGTLVAWAKELGLTEAATILQQTLDEEKKTDQILNKLALKRVNRQAKAA
jgi:ferritin-like metal-binding protein YciE